jgi:hypothetical protein
MGTRVLDMVIEGNLGLRPYMFLLIIKVPDQHVQHVLRYFFVIVGSTLLGLSEALTSSRRTLMASHIIQLVYFGFFYVSTSFFTSRAVLGP